MAKNTVLDVGNFHIDKINTERGYWFVRTDSGDNFDAFYKNSFVGIGWNEITERDLELPAYDVKKKIARIYKINDETKRGKIQVTGIYNKIIKFRELKKNDVVVIPSRSSSRLAFGIVKDDKLHFDHKPVDGCDYIKRRSIKWLKVVHISALDNIFYKIIPSRHSISSIKKYENYIDNVTNTLYEKEGYVHFVLNVRKEGDIDLQVLLSLMASIQTLSDKIENHFQLNESDKLSIRLNIQSPGKIELKKKIGIAIVVLGMMFASCTGAGGNLDGKNVNNKSLSDFAQLETDTLSKIDTAIKELDIRIDGLN